MSAVQDESALESLALRASERFAWHWEAVPIAGKNRQLAIATDPEGMLIEACERQDAGERGVIDPFWVTTWRAAAGVDRYLDRLDLSSMRVLELGCGTGHAGLAAAYRGGRVTLTDGVSDPLLLVQMSTWTVRDRCQVRRLRFGLDRLAGPRFPLILGSDVTYLRALWPQLDQSLQDHLDEGGEVLLSDPFRIIANEFRDWIQDRDWLYSEHRVELDDDPMHPIRIMQLRRK
jgi:predicted nicotinamide N-methyase